jgi:hypothetical protein
MKRPTKKFFGKHPFLNILTNKFYYMDFYEFSMNLNWHSIFSIFSQPSLFILHIFSKAYRLIWEENNEFHKMSIRYHFPCFSWKKIKYMK